MILSLFHTPGPNMYIADLLSTTNGREVTGDKSIKQCAMVERYVEENIESLLEKSPRKGEARVETERDGASQQVCEYIVKGRPYSLEGE